MLKRALRTTPSIAFNPSLHKSIHATRLATAVTIRGDAAPTEKLPVEAGAAYKGLAALIPVVPNSSRACAPSASRAIRASATCFASAKSSPRRTYMAASSRCSHALSVSRFACSSASAACSVFPCRSEKNCYIFASCQRHCPRHKPRQTDSTSGPCWACADATPIIKLAVEIMPSRAEY